MSKLDSWLDTPVIRDRCKLTIYGGTDMSYKYIGINSPGIVPDECIEKVTGPVKGYKAFNIDWTCIKKQYTCPGKFEETGEIEMCRHGMHFCPELRNVYNYYSFNSDTKVAEVIATGEIYKDLSDDDKMVTSNLEIVREVSWTEVNRLLNTGKGNIGAHNTGDDNLFIGNTGNYNRGNSNSGNYNIGKNNTGSGNIGNNNTGGCNNGNYNTGNYNDGDWNIGDFNKGNCNIGDFNKGKFNTGVFNINDGDDTNIYMFNKPSDWTMYRWKMSLAYKLLTSMPKITTATTFITKNEIAAMDGTEEKGSPVYNAKCVLENIGDTDDAVGVLVHSAHSTDMDRQNWWKKLRPSERMCILQLPNFDKDIFYKFTGIDVYDVDLVDPNDESLFGTSYTESAYYYANAIVGEYDHPKGGSDDE